MKDHEVLNASEMFNLIRNKLYLQKKEFTFLTSNLNVETLRETLKFSPKILIIYCHGDSNRETNIDDEITLWVERDDVSSLVNPLDKTQLWEVLKKYRDSGVLKEVKLVILSACYSGEIGKLLVEQGFPAVIAISPDTPVLENAAKIFNQKLI